MVLTESEAIVLRTYKLAEADKIVVFLSRKSGLVRGVARGARRLKSRFGAGLEPFTKVFISWAEKEERELVSIRQVEIRESFFNHSSWPGLFEVLERVCADTLLFAQPHQPDERLYRMVAACVEAVGRTPEAAEAVLTYFELWLLKLSGFLPDLSACGRCGKQLGFGKAEVKTGADGVLFCAACAGESFQSLDGETHSCLIFFRHESPLKWSERLLLRDSFVRTQVANFAAGLISRAAGYPAGRANLAASREGVSFSRGFREDVLR